MFRQKTGSVVCASCGSLVGVNDDKCYTCGRRNPGLWGFGPVLRRFGSDLGFTTAIVYGCAVVYTLSLLLTVLSGGAIHILFNVMWVRQLGPAVGDIYGAARMVIIYTLSSISGFLLSSVLAYYTSIPFFSGGWWTLGASAPIFGLLGALVHYGRRGGSSLVGSQALNYAIMMGVFGLIMPGIDNSAHLGGFI